MDSVDNKKNTISNNDDDDASPSSASLLLSPQKYFSKHQQKLEEQKQQQHNNNMQTQTQKKRVYLSYPPMPPFHHPDVTRKDIDTFADKLKLTLEEIDEIEKAPQRSEKWLNGKERRIGASSCGAAAGNNKYQPPKQLCGQMLWKELRQFTSSIMQRGIEKEDVTTQMMEVYYTSESRHRPGQARLIPEGESAFWRDFPDDIWMDSRNFIICHEHPWMGASTDGIFVDMYNESKAPGSNRFYPTTPPQYFCQFQQGMYILKMKKAVLSVYTERGIQLRYYDFDEDFWHNDLFPALHDFYFNQYVPREILKQKELLARTCVDPEESAVDVLSDIDKHKINLLNSSVG